MKRFLSFGAVIFCKSSDWEDCSRCFWPTISGGLGPSVLVCTHVWWMLSHRLKQTTPGGAGKGTGALFKWAKVSRCESAFPASLKVSPCLVAEAWDEIKQLTESNSSTFYKEWEAQNLPECHMGINLLQPWRGAVANVTNKVCNVSKKNTGRSEPTISDVWAAFHPNVHRHAFALNCCEGSCVTPKIFCFLKSAAAFGMKSFIHNYCWQGQGQVLDEKWRAGISYKHMKRIRDLF